MMKISTKGRYALRVMIDLAENYSGEYIPLKDIAKRQEISEKYLESIISMLTKGGILSGHRGKGGGYKLTRDPAEYTVGDILKITEGSLAPVSCLECTPNTCERVSECRTLPIWENFYKLIEDYFEGITLLDLVAGDQIADNYVI